MYEYKINCPIGGMPDLYIALNQVLGFNNPKMIINHILTKFHIINPKYTFTTNQETLDVTASCSIFEKNIVGYGTGRSQSDASKIASVEALKLFIESSPHKSEMYKVIVDLLPIEVRLNSKEKYVNKLESNCSLLDKLIKLSVSCSYFKSGNESIEKLRSEIKKLGKYEESCCLRPIGSYYLGCITSQRPIDIITLSEGNCTIIDDVPLCTLLTKTVIPTFKITKTKLSELYDKIQFSVNSCLRINMLICKTNDYFNNSMAAWIEDFDKSNRKLPAYKKCLMAIRYWARSTKQRHRVNVRKIDKILNLSYDSKETICNNLISVFAKLESKYNDLDLSCDQAKEISKSAIDFIYHE